MFILFAKYVECLVVATYLCEHLFPLMKQNKNIERSQLTDTHLSLIIKVTSTPYINKLGRNKCTTFPENMIRYEVEGSTQTDNLIYVFF